MLGVPRKLWGWSALSALLQLLPFPIAGPVPEWRRFFCWFCLVPLLCALNDREIRPKQAAWLGYFCGVLWYLGNCYWIYPTMHTYGAMASPVAAVILLLFAMYVGLYHALFGWLIGMLRARLSPGTTLLFAPFVWVSVELARARITGFPWDLLGNTQVDAYHISVLSRVTGVMGLSLIVAIVNSVWFLKPRRMPWAGAALGALSMGIALLLSGKRMWEPAKDLPEAVLMQDNLSVGAEGNGIHEAKDALLDDFSRRSVAAMQKAQGPSRVAVILWPEAPADFFDGDPEFRAALGALAAQQHVAVIADDAAVDRNVPAGQQPRFYNSASFFAPDGSYAGRYDKMHLVPFGEYTPYKQIFFFAGHLLDNVGGFTPGAAHTLLAAQGHRYGVFICYESIFGDEIRELAKSGADVLVNLSDDGWYGDSSAPWEHLDMVRMRAIENDRWVLRSTNTGITASIAPDGRIVAQLPRHERDALLAPFAYVEETTFYTRHGDWIAWMCAALTAAALLFGFTRRGEVH